MKTKLVNKRGGGGRSDKPRVIFFGTPAIACKALAELVNAGYIPLAIVTNPDRPAGRKRLITPPPVKQFVMERQDEWKSIQKPGVKIFQPERVSEIEQELRGLKSDIFIVAAYGKLIPRAILDIPHRGTIGIHPSLLPLYRGPSPIQTAILEGAHEVGVTLYMIDEKMDEGPIIAQKKISGYTVGEKNNEELSRELFALGGRMAAEILENLAARGLDKNGHLPATQQDHARATYTKKFTTEDAFIPEKDLQTAQRGEGPALARAIHQKILAFTPEPGAWTTRNEKRLKLLASRLENDRLVLTLAQEEGKKPLRVN